MTIARKMITVRGQRNNKRACALGAPRRLVRYWISKLIDPLISPRIWSCWRARCRLVSFKDLWALLERLRAGPEIRSGLLPVCPELVAGAKFFGRYRTGFLRRVRAAEG
jgi:hypothetical protein